MLNSRIAELTVPCSDDGNSFIHTERLDLIRSSLADSIYECIAGMPLAKLYRHRDFCTGKPAMLISCHIDSIYDEYHASVGNGELTGTFDNSACNAVTVEAMLQGLLPPQVLISFTGDEEYDSGGVDQTVEFLRQDNVLDDLELVIVLDLTEEHYRSSHFTIENYFVRREDAHGLLRFRGRRELKTYLRSMIDSAIFVKDAEPDESWQYDEYDMNCLTFCLPCRLLGEDMHDDVGVAILEESPAQYLNALVQLTNSVNDDVFHRANHRLP